jgi:formate dehydrogenase accessory protein FdhE
MAGNNGNSILHNLEALVREYHEISEAAEFYAALLPLLHTANVQAGPLPLTPDRAREKLENGVPLLEGLDLPFEDQAACSLMLRLTDLLEAMPAGKELTPARSAAARDISRLLEQGKVKASAVLRQASPGNPSHVRALALAWHVDADVLWLLARYTLTPYLRDWARQLTPLVDKAEWHQSRCYICGAEALLGELQGAEAAKHLRCGQCGADWAGRRLGCAYCGNERLETFGYLSLEANSNGKRVEVCDACKGYLKVIVRFDPTPPEELLIQDLATVHLDYVAQERGYVRK